MFFWAAMGNLSYTLSILNSREAVDPATRQKFLREAVPYVLGSSGTLMFDLSIFCQWLYYTGRFWVLDRILDRVFGGSRYRRHAGSDGGGMGGTIRRQHHRHHHARQRGSHHSRLDNMALSPSGSQSGLYDILVDEEDYDPDLDDSRQQQQQQQHGQGPEQELHQHLLPTSNSSLPEMIGDNNHTHSP